MHYNSQIPELIRIDKEIRDESKTKEEFKMNAFRLKKVLLKLKNGVEMKQF